MLQKVYLTLPSLFEKTLSKTTPLNVRRCFMEVYTIFKSHTCMKDALQIGGHSTSIIYSWNIQGGKR